jgi:hypothetical protein
MHLHRESGGMFFGEWTTGTVNGPGPLHHLGPGQLVFYGEWTVSDVSG